MVYPESKVKVAHAHLAETRLSPPYPCLLLGEPGNEASSHLATEARKLRHVPSLLLPCLSRPLCIRITAQNLKLPPIYGF